MPKRECHSVAEKELLEMRQTFAWAEKMLDRGICNAVEIESAIRNGINQYMEAYNKSVFESKELSPKSKEYFYGASKEEQRKLYRKMWRLLLKYSKDKIQ